MKQSVRHRTDTDSHDIVYVKVKARSRPPGTRFQLPRRAVPHTSSSDPELVFRNIRGAGCEIRLSTRERLAAILGLNPISWGPHEKDWARDGLAPNPMLTAS